MPERIAHRGALLALVVTVAVIAAAAVYVLPAPSMEDRAEARFLLLAAAAVLSSVRSVRISRLRIDLVAYHPFVLMAIALFGTRPAVLLGAVCVVTAASLRDELPPVLRFVFNLGASTIATVAAGLVFARLGVGNGGGTAHLVVPLLVATLVFFFVKTALVAAAISLELGRSFVQTWTHSLGWTLASDLMAVPIVLGALAVFDSSPVAGTAMVLAPCWLIWLFYRAQGNRRGSASGDRPGAPVPARQ